MMRCSTLAVVGGLVVCTGSAWAIDNHIPLNYNWNGIYHVGEVFSVDDPNGFRSIADRSIVVDGGAFSFGTVPLAGNTGISYTFQAGGGVLDCVHLGNTALSTATGTCPGCPTRWFDLTTGLNANRGIQPAWLAGLSDHLMPQTTDVSALNLTLDSLSSIGVLYHITNGGGNFQMVLMFTDASSVTVTLAGNDWFGPVNPPVAGLGVASQALMPPNSGTRRTFTGASNTDSPIVQPYPTQDLGIVEAVVSVAEMLNDGLGNHAGKTLQSITFQAPNQPNRGYAIFSCTVVNGLGPPANDSCAGAFALALGSNAGENIRATESVPSTCGNGDTKDVWYTYTAASSGLHEIRTCGSALDTTITRYATCGGSAISCNDHGCGLASRLQWTAVANTTYTFRVAVNGGGEGQFTIDIDDAPQSHSDLPIPLAYNWNGMVHPGEEGQPDNPDGFRSISDRALHVHGGPGAINGGVLVGTDFIPYVTAPNAGTLDIVHLGLTGSGASPRFWDAAPDGDNMGIRPDWLTNLDHRPPQRTDLTPLAIAMGPSTRVGVLYNVSNNGGVFDVTLEFADASSVSVTVHAPDWYQDQHPTGPLPGVEVQRQLGQYSATSNQDMATTGAPLLNVVEAVFSTTSLLNAGLGDHTGKRLIGLTFQNASPGDARGYAVYAATFRDTVPDSSPTPPTGVGAAIPNPGEIGRFQTFTVTTFPGTNPPSTGIQVQADLSQLGGSSNQPFFDDGFHGDGNAGDGVFGFQMTIAQSQGLGNYALPFSVADNQSRSSNGNIALTVNAYAWNELVDGGSDAGELPNFHQVLIGTGPVGAIVGNNAANDTDMFEIEICDLFNFSASTVGASFDTQLFLFNLDGTGVSFNDDASGTASIITFGFVPGPGRYLLAITRYNRDPVDEAGQLLWNNTPFNVERAPDGPGMFNPVASWTGVTTAAGAYRINLTGACFPNLAPPCDPDVNCDGSANGIDVEIMELAVGGDFTDFCQVGIPGVDDGDFNRDGAVNGTDVEAVENAVGGICP
ncbi:MAG: hypothetical protein HBSAPP03_20160 [Phycisphaerae bacterium]|nr:MAG: hypothetical protein HBSAPP03_20160 [Phycisphaerae bacterium]